jgi:hypothetical protein
MKRRIAAALLLMAGCSTNPIADVCDRFCPARGVCSRATSSPVGAPGVAAVPGAPAQPGCEAALKENQNYRKGLFERFRRRSAATRGVPPAAVVPAVNP